VLLRWVRWEMVAHTSAAGSGLATSVSRYGIAATLQFFGIHSAMHSPQLYQFGNAEWRLGAILTVSAGVELPDPLVAGTASDGSASPLA
jgi:hypothetical protein